jgi:hypothetical protein
MTTQEQLIEKLEELVKAYKISNWTSVDKLQSIIAALKSQIEQEEKLPERSAEGIRDFIQEAFKNMVGKKPTWIELEKQNASVDLYGIERLLLDYHAQFASGQKEVSLPSDEEIDKWAKKIQPIRGGYLTDYIYSAKWMRNLISKLNGK